MNTPTKIEWDIGQDIHGRRVVLRQVRNAGVASFVIISEPVNQRDEGEEIHSLSRANLEAITGLLHGRAV